MRAKILEEVPRPGGDTFPVILETETVSVHDRIGVREKVFRPQ